MAPPSPNQHPHNPQSHFNDQRDAKFGYKNSIWAQKQSELAKAKDKVLFC